MVKGNKLDWTSPIYLYSKINEFQKRFPNYFVKPLEEFCESQNINLIPYHNYEKEVCSISPDGFCFISHGEYNIFYNINKPRTRQKFTISHEIGHIYLNHHKYIDPKVLKYGRNNTGIWETQANIFAQNVLIPAEFADILQIHGIDEMARYFGLSKSMVTVRMAKLEQDKKWLDAIKNF